MNEKMSSSSYSTTRGSERFVSDIVAKPSDILFYCRQPGERAPDECEYDFTDSSSSESLDSDHIHTLVKRESEKHDIFEPPVGPNKKDPYAVTNITRVDSDLVFRKWRYIRHDLITFSELLLLEFENTGLETLNKINPFPKEECVKNLKYLLNKASLRRVFHLCKFLNKIIMELDNLDRVCYTIYEMAGPHGKLINKPLTVNDTQALVDTFTKVIQISYTMGNSPDVEKAYKKVLTIIFRMAEDLTHWNDFSVR